MARATLSRRLQDAGSELDAQMARMQTALDLLSRQVAALTTALEAAQREAALRGELVGRTFKRREQ